MHDRAARLGAEALWVANDTDLARMAPLKEGDNPTCATRAERSAGYLSSCRYFQILDMFVPRKLLFAELKTWAALEEVLRWQGDDVAERPYKRGAARRRA